MRSIRYIRIKNHTVDAATDEIADQPGLILWTIVDTQVAEIPFSAQQLLDMANQTHRDIGVQVRDDQGHGAGSLALQHFSVHIRPIPKLLGDTSYAFARRRRYFRLVIERAPHRGEGDIRGAGYVFHG